MIPNDAEPITDFELWDWSTSDPLSDIVMAACRFEGRTGKASNTVALNRQQMIDLAMHPDIREHAKQFGQIISVFPKPEQLAAVLGLNVIQHDGLREPMVYLASPDISASGECAQCGAGKVPGRVTCPGCGATYKE